MSPSRPGRYVASPSPPGRNLGGPRASPLLTSSQHCLSTPCSWESCASTIPCRVCLRIHNLFMSLQDVTAHRIMALHDTRPVDRFASETASADRYSGNRCSSQLVAGNRHRTRDAISSISPASSAPSSACVLSVAAPPADVPSSLRSTSLQWRWLPVLALVTRHNIAQAHCR